MVHKHPRAKFRLPLGLTTLSSIHSSPARLVIKRTGATPHANNTKRTLQFWELLVVVSRYKTGRHSAVTETFLKKPGSNLHICGCLIHDRGAHRPANCQTRNGKQVTSYVGTIVIIPAGICFLNTRLRSATAKRFNSN